MKLSKFIKLLESVYTDENCLITYVVTNIHVGGIGLEFILQKPDSDGVLSKEELDRMNAIVLAFNKESIP